MHLSLTELEREAYRKSFVHNLDGRIKLLMTLVILVYAVALPRMDALNFMKLGFIEIYLVILILLARLEIKYLIIRFAIALPFGLSIAVLQPFLKQPFNVDFNVLYSLPFGLEITREGTLFGAIIFAKFFICATA